MAIARATGNLSFKVLPNEIRKRFNGTCNYTGPDANDKWIYKKFVVDESSDKIFLTSDEFLGISTSAALVLTNPVRFIMIKHTGFTDANENVSTTIGVLLTFTGAAPVFDSDDDENTPIFLAAGDTVALKVPVSQADDWRAITCKVSSGIPSAVGAGGDDVLIEIAAIIDDND